MKSSCPSAEKCSAEIRFQNLHYCTHFHMSLNASNLFMFGLCNFGSYLQAIML